MKKRTYAQKLIPFIIIAISLYTIACFVLQFKYQIEPSPTLTTAYFAFWGTEIISLATIKTKKIKMKDAEDDCFADGENVDE